MSVSNAQSSFCLCCRYLGFFRAIGPITVAVLGIAITNIWHLECPTSDKNKVCASVCVCLCLLCVHELSEAHGHATCSFSMLFALHTTVCSIATAASLFSAPCVSVLHSLLGLACEHMHPRASSASHCVHRVFCHAVKQHTVLCSIACKILQTNV